jgi:hypothetical protein
VTQRVTQTCRKTSCFADTTRGKLCAVSPDNPKAETAALQELINTLSAFDEETRIRLLKTVVTFLDIKGVRMAGAGEVRFSDFIVPGSSTLTGDARRAEASPPFSDRPDISPKEFILDKEPRTDVERVACLAYYLTHFLNTPHFKTLDVSKLNTDAAQPKFSNATVAVDNAAKLGFLVPAVKGTKQLSALGEQFVRALPDREAAKAVRAKVRRRRAKKSPKDQPESEEST